MWIFHCESQEPAWVEGYTLALAKALIVILGLSLAL